jgi:hypothetical protein
MLLSEPCFKSFTKREVCDTWRQTALIDLSRESRNEVDELVKKAIDTRYPEIRVEPDAIYVRDGPIWTSAGVTTGIDLALALIEQDCGRTVAMHVARVLVVYLRRVGRPVPVQRPSGVSGGVGERDVCRLGALDR